MAEDKVYCQYVIPFYREEKLRAEKAENQLSSVIRSMLNSGLDTALIMKCTGLSAGEIAALSEKK
jgi:hypothetical protein